MKTRCLLNLALTLSLLLLLLLFGRALEPTAFSPSAPNTSPQTLSQPTSETQALDDDWRIEVIDSAGLCGTDLQVDAEGRPHVVYGGDSLVYGWRGDNQWHLQTLDASVDLDRDVLLDLEADTGYPHISYCLRSEGACAATHAWFDGSDWQTEAISGTDGITAFSSFALDANDYVHGCYLDGWNGVPKYAYQDAAGWHFETLGNERMERISLALDQHGQPHIIYDNDYDILTYTWFDGADWHTQAIPMPDTGHITAASLALDPFDRPHVVYSLWGKAGFVHTWRDDDDWHSQVVGDEVIITNTSLVIDALGRPHLGYTESFPNYTVKYAWYDGIAWRTGIVDVEGGGGISLTLDERGHPHLSYKSGEGEIKYATNDSIGLFMVNKQTTPAAIYANETLTYTLSLLGPGVQTQLWDPLPNNVDYVTGSLSSTLSPAPTYSPSAHAITWQGALTTTTLEIVQFQATPNITAPETLSVSQPITNTFWLTDIQSVEAFSATVSATLLPPRLELDKHVVHAADLRHNRTLTYTLHLTGAGLPVYFQDPLPANLDYISGSLSSTLDPPPAYSPTARAILWQGVLPGDIQTLSFQALPNTDNLPLIVHNTAWLTSATSGAFISAQASITLTNLMDEWQIETLECAREFIFMSNRYLRLDSAGHPHLVYGDKCLYYARHDGTQWHFKAIDTTPGVGKHVSLSLDGLDYPHISYYDETNQDLKYAYYDGDTWHIEVVDNQVAIGWDAPLALDPLSGQPCISYRDQDSDSLNYAARTQGGEWRVEIVDAAPGSGWASSLALDQTGLPHISYVDWQSQQLKYAHYDGSAWHIEVIDSSHYSPITSLALDSSGHPHIVFNGVTNLKYARRDGTDWHIQMLDIASYYWDASITLDAADQPHIVYSPEFLVKYSWYDGADWRTETINTLGGHNTSLALNAQGQPHISFVADASLKYTWYDGANWHEETVDWQDDIKNPSLALDPINDQARISYFSQDFIKYAQHTQNWDVERIARSPGFEHTVLATDATGRPHIIFSSHMTTMYATHDGADWQVETVQDHSGSPGWRASLDIDRNGHPHVSYARYDQDYSLEYAWRNDDGWHFQSVDHATCISHSSLALDQSGHPHIVYEFCLDPHDLKYAWFDGDYWHISTINDSWEAHAPSLALDQTGRPHITYHQDDALGYAYLPAPDANWQHEIVQSSLGVQMHQQTPIALDSLDRPHVSYYDAVNDCINYGWWDGSGWRIETVDDDGGRDISLALDSRNLPHISYTNNKNVSGGGNYLNYAYRLAPRLSLVTQVTPGDELQYNNILTYSLKPAGLGPVHLSDPLPASVSYVANSLSNTLEPAAVYSPAVHSILWQGWLPTDTIQTIQFQVTSNIDPHTLAAPLPITNSVWLTQTNSGRVVSSTTRVNLLPIPLSLGNRATPQQDVWGGETLTYSLTLNGPGLQARLYEPLPPGVNFVSGSISSTLNPLPVYSPTIGALVWQGQLLTDSIQTLQFQVTVGGSGSLSVPHAIVNTAWLTATESARDLSATVIVNGWQVYLPAVMRQAP